MILNDGSPTRYDKRNAMLILSFLVVLLFAKLKAQTYEPTRQSNQLNSHLKPSSEDPIYTELEKDIAGEDGSLESQNLDYDTKPRQGSEYQISASEDLEAPSNEEFESIDNHDHGNEMGQYMDYYNELEDSLSDLSKSKWYEGRPDQLEENANTEERFVDYNEELTNIIGKKLDDIEVLLAENKIEVSKKNQVIEDDSPNSFSPRKTRMYAVHPYQIKNEKAPDSAHGPIMYLTIENEDESSPLRYYQQIGRTSNYQYSYLPKKNDLLLKLFPGLASSQYSNKQSIKTKTNIEGGTQKKETSSTAVHERMNMGWPFGHDLNKKPSYYSIMHKVKLNHPQSAIKKKTNM